MVEIHHGLLDQIRGRTLDPRVHRLSFGLESRGHVLRLDVGQATQAAQSSVTLKPEAPAAEAPAKPDALAQRPSPALKLKWPAV